MARILEGQNFIPSFKDPSVALEATQGNQTYVFEQPLSTFGNVEDELTLSPDWQPQVHYASLSTTQPYYSTDQMEWNLLQPSKLTDWSYSPDEDLNRSTGLSNDYTPVNRSMYSKNLSYQPLSTTQTQVGKLTVPAWDYLKKATADSGLADN